MSPSWVSDESTSGVRDGRADDAPPRSPLSTTGSSVTTPCTVLEGCHGAVLLRGGAMTDTGSGQPWPCNSTFSSTPLHVGYFK